MKLYSFRLSLWMANIDETTDFRYQNDLSIKLSRFSSSTLNLALKFAEAFKNSDSRIELLFFSIMLISLFSGLKSIFHDYKSF